MCVHVCVFDPVWVLQDDVHGLMKTSSTANINFFEGTALYSETSILVQTAPPMHPGNDAMSGEDAASTDHPSEHQLDQASLEQLDHAESLSDGEVPDSVDVDSDITSSSSSSSSVEDQLHDDAVDDTDVDADVRSVFSGNAVTIASCNDLATSYAATMEERTSLVVVSGIVMCADQKVQSLFFSCQL